MTTFDQRKKAFENKFFHDEEAKFKLASRRRKLLGLWAAEQMHKSEEDSLEYALDIVRLGMEDSREGAVVRKLMDDMQAIGLHVTEEDIREQMDVLHTQAARELTEQAEEEE